MPALDGLSREDFEPHVQSAFRHTSEQDTYEFTLMDISPLSEMGLTAGGRAAFSLIFQCRPAAMLEQQIYRLEHEAMGALELFLVPVAAPKDDNGEGTYFEAVFA